MKKENKIDDAIDEILESKRVQQGASFFKKITTVLLILFVLWLIIGIIAKLLEL